VSDEDLQEDEPKVEAANVWARGGEGPHAQVPLPAAEAAQAAGAKSAAMADLADLVVMAGTASTAESSTEARASAPEESPGSGRQEGKDKGAEPAHRGEDWDHAERSEDVEHSGEAQSSDKAKSSDTAKSSDAAESANADALDGEGEQSDEEESDEEEDDQEESPGEPAGDGSPSKDEIAVGYIIPLVLYFVVYIANAAAGHYCMTSDKINALGEIVFYWAPALCAFCLLFGSRWLSVAGAILILPLGAAAIFAGQYFHAYERFQTNTGPYGPFVSAYDAKGWHICSYKSGWATGNQPGTTFTREKSAGPGIKYVKKMGLGEPP